MISALHLLLFFRTRVCIQTYRYWSLPSRSARSHACIPLTFVLDLLLLSIKFVCVCTCSSVFVCVFDFVCCDIVFVTVWLSVYLYVCTCVRCTCMCVWCVVCVYYDCVWMCVCVCVCVCVLFSTIWKEDSTIRIWIIFYFQILSCFEVKLQKYIFFVKNKNPRIQIEP